MAIVSRLAQQKGLPLLLHGIKVSAAAAASVG